MDNSVPRIQLKRVNPFMGLMIDAQTWGDSHEYHRLAAQAHGLALHGWGIVAGLEVDAAEPADRSVWIRPGVAVDPDGRLILVAQPFRYQITTTDPGMVYLVLVFREIPTQNAISVEDGSEKPSRLLEAYAIYERDRLPDQAHVELARITLGDAKSPLKEAADHTAPKPNEVDVRYREQAAIRPGPRTTVGVWKPAELPDKMLGQLAGPTRLMSALTSGVDWRLRRRDQPQGAAEEPIDADLIIMPVHAKLSFTDNERKRLVAFLDGGGVLLADAPVTGTPEDQRMVASVAQALGRKPKPVERSHPLLTARHVFSAPPPGAATAQLFEDAGLVVSSADYCSTWNGGAPDKPLDRSIIRSAVEFAENLLAYALVRKGNVNRARRNERKG
jgi:hypothetical protein